MRALRPLAATAATLVGLSALVLTSSSPAGAVEVADEAALRAAFADPAETGIELSADITIDDDCSDPQMLRTDPTADLVIDGNGHTITFPCDGGSWSLFVVDDAPASFNTLTLRDLTAVDTGTGMSVAYVDGWLALEDVETDGWWDVLVADEITVDRSYLHDGDGGSAVQPDTDATVRSSTLAGFDYGVEAGGTIEDEIVVVNSTISGMAEAGIIARGTSTTLTHVTFADNGTHLEAVGGQLTTTASAYGASGTEPCDLTTPPAITSGGHNAVVGSCGFSGTGDIEGASIADLALGALAGTPIPVHAPSTGSLLVDAITSACAVPADQLGTSRPRGGGCEIGAVEVLPASQPTPTSTPSPTAPPATPRAARPTFTG